MATKKTKKAAPKKSAGKKAYAGAAKVPRGVSSRVKALSAMGGNFCDNDKKLQEILNTIKDTSAPLEVRLTAIQAMMAASFSSPNFNACRPDFLATLRAVSADPHVEIRERVLGVLARENDGYAQKVMLEGLQDPSKALLSPEKALQLLSYDIHAEAYPVAQKIVEKPPNEAAKREALRLLAADAGSVPLFEKLYKSKKEPVEIRQLAASALHALAPEKLQQHARKIVMDANEGDELKATSLTAITHFADDANMAKDNSLYKQVDKLRTGASSPALKRVSRQFVSKYSR
jgi:hypothetical protein